jgi:membrane protein YdbS with pleckstrin-like domain
VLPPDEPEQELWTGRFSGKALSHLLLLAFVWLTVIAIVYFKWLNKDSSWKPFFNWACTILALAPFVYIGWLYLYSKLAIRYRLTTHRFFLTRGIFARRMDEIELVRVDDVSVSQNILQRIFNVGDVTLIASDSTDPRLEIQGIDDPISVKEQIRTNVQKRGRRSVNLRQV